MKHRINIGLTIAVLQQLKEAAALEKRSVSSMAAVIIEKHLNNNDRVTSSKGDKS